MLQYKYVLMNWQEKRRSCKCNSLGKMAFFGLWTTIGIQCIFILKNKRLSTSNKIVFHYTLLKLKLKILTLLQMYDILSWR